jgi:hypothetical protein
MILLLLIFCYPVAAALEAELNLVYQTTERIRKFYLWWMPVIIAMIFDRFIEFEYLYRKYKLN